MLLMYIRIPQRIPLVELFMGSILWIGANVNTYTCVFIFVCALFVCPELVIEIQQLPHVFEWNKI